MRSAWPGSRCVAFASSRAGATSTGHGEECSSCSGVLPASAPTSARWVVPPTTIISAEALAAASAIRAAGRRSDEDDAQLGLESASAQVCDLPADLGRAVILVGVQRPRAASPRQLPDVNDDDAGLTLAGELGGVAHRRAGLLDAVQGEHDGVGHEYHFPFVTGHVLALDQG